MNILIFSAWLLWWALGQAPYYTLKPEAQWTFAEAFDSKRDCEASDKVRFYKIWNEIAHDEYKKTKDKKALEYYVHWQCLPESMKP